MLEPLFNNVAGLQAATLTLKKRLQHKYFPVHIAKFSRAVFFIEHFLWLLLHFEKKATAPFSCEWKLEAYIGRI